MKTLVSDIDGTILNKGVQPITSTIQFITSHKRAGWRVVIITGRPESARAETDKALFEAKVPYDSLLMNKLGESHPKQLQSKEDNLKTLGQVDLAIDNDPVVLKMYKLDGVTTVVDPAKIG